MLRQYPLSPAVGKRLIANGIVAHPWVSRSLHHGRVVIVAGTTNGYVAEEMLKAIGQSKGFRKQAFLRGVNMSPLAASRRASGGDTFIGDVVIEGSVWQQGKSIFDVARSLGPNDLILKGANALDVQGGLAAAFVDRPDGGTVGAILPAVLGRQAKLLVPVGLEKRIHGNLAELSQRLAHPDAAGVRLCMLPGPVFTEIDAITQLTGAKATLVGAGGVAGAEGGVWLAIEDTAENLDQVDVLMREISAEPPFDAGLTS